MKKLKELKKFYNFTQETLAKKLSMDKNTISFYESGKALPSFKSLKKIVFFFDISFDFFLLGEGSLYPRNLKLIRLAKELDHLQAQDRTHIEVTAESFLKNKKNDTSKIKLDDIDISLSNDFHSNLKKIRNIKNIQQIDLAKALQLSRSSISMYEFSNFPTPDKLIKIAKIFNVSIHALATGKKLNFTFKDGHFGDTMLLADHYLPLEDHKVLIRLMENIIGDKQEA